MRSRSHPAPRPRSARAVPAALAALTTIALALLAATPAAAETAEASETAVETTAAAGDPDRGDGSSGDIPVQRSYGRRTDIPYWTRFGYMGASFGWRQSFTLGAGGLDVRGCIGGFFGPVGVEIEAGYSSDGTFLALENREAARYTTWLSAQLRLHPVERLAVFIGVGPGLGWIKDPDQEPMVRHPSQGLREWAQLSVFLGEPVGRYAMAFRAGPEQLWQDAIVDGVEHSLAVRLMFTIGTLWSPDD